jgi:AraC-like DNA-binding protein
MPNSLIVLGNVVERPVLSTGKPLISARLIEGLDWYMRTKGMPLQAFADEAGIDLRVIDDPDGFVEFDRGLALLEIVARGTGNAALGVLMAAACPIRPVNLHYFMIKNAPTLRDALEHRARYSRFLTNAYSVRLEMAGDRCSFTWEMGTVTGPRAQFEGYAASLFVEFIRQVLSVDWVPAQVDLPHKAPAAVEEYRRVLGPRINFGAALTRVWIDTEDLSRILPAADPLLYRVLRQSIDKAVRAPLPARTVLDKTREHIIRASSYTHADEKTVANAIGVSVRSLQRELQENGTTFRALADDARKRAALQLLHDTDLPLTEVAFLLCFSELSAFSRAARNWFGDSASNVRKRARDS